MSSVNRRPTYKPVKADGREKTQAAASRKTEKTRFITDDELISLGSDEHIYVLEKRAIYGDPIGILQMLVHPIKNPHSNLDFIPRYARDFIMTMAFGDRGKEKGRAGNPLAKLRQDRIHMTRAETSVSYRDKQAPKAERRLKPGEHRSHRDHKRRVDALGNGFRGTDAFTSRLLSQAGDKIGADAIKRSRLLTQQGNNLHGAEAHPLMDKLLAVAPDGTLAMSIESFDEALFGENYRAPAKLNLYVPEHDRLPRDARSNVPRSEKAEFSLFLFS